MLCSLDIVFSSEGFPGLGAIWPHLAAQSLTILLSRLGWQAETANARLLCTASFYMESERLSVCNLIMRVSRRYLVAP